MSGSARPVIGILNENKVRPKVAFFQPEIFRAVQSLAGEGSGREDDRCDLSQGGSGSELAPAGVFVCCVKNEANTEYIPFQ